MRLVFLYGPPGVGKLAVARELAALTGFRVLHNHLTRDLVEAVFPRGSAPHGPLIRSFRRQMLEMAVREDVDLVFTYVYVHPHDDDDVQSMIEPVRSHGGAVLFAQLMCARDELLARVASESRRAYGKLMDPAIVSTMLDRGDFTAAMPFAESMRIDTTDVSPAEAATEIVTHYSLPTITHRVGGRESGAPA